MTLTTRARVLQRLGLTDDAATSSPGIALRATAITGGTPQMTLNTTNRTLSINQSSNAAPPVVFNLDDYTLETLTTALSAFDYSAANLLFTAVSTYVGTIANTPASLINGPVGSNTQLNLGLVTLTYANQSAGTTGNFIDRLIDEVSAQVESYCGRKFALQTHTEIYDPRGSASIILRNAPVAPDSVTVWRIDESGGDTEIDSDALTIDEPAGILYISRSFRRGLSGFFDQPHRRGGDIPAFAPGVQSIKVQYDAGYATIPEDLADAATRLVVARFMDRRANLSLASEGNQGRSVSRLQSDRQLMSDLFGTYRRNLIP